MANEKIRVIQDFEKLSEEIQEQIKLSYPYGFTNHLIRFVNKEGKYVSALPFETDTKYYLVRMTQEEASEIIDQDDDYDEDGSLKEDVKEEFEDKYSDKDYLFNDDGEEEEDRDDDY